MAINAEFILSYKHIVLDIKDTEDFNKLKTNTKRRSMIFETKQSGKTVSFFVARGILYRNTK